jgi:ATP-dependent Clp protease protease subunit
MSAENKTNSNQEQTQNVQTIIKKREFLLNENVSATSVKSIILGINDINRYDDEQQEADENYVRKPIKLIVDSFGGIMYDGFALANLIDTSKTPVHTYCYGKAMSMGLVIFLSGHKRIMHPFATLMYHDASNVVSGTMEEIDQSVNQTKRLVKVVDYLITSTSKVEQKKLNRIKREVKNWYLFGDEAFELGLADELLKSTKRVDKQ